MTTSNSPSLREKLTYQPVALQFGTSGRRGLVVDLTQLEIFINAVAELEFLQSLPKAEGGIIAGEEFYFARDLRPSSSHYVAEHQGRGELAQAIELAIHHTGMIPVNLGQIPTPALTCYALSKSKGSMMITGSHIPFERNGYKTNTSAGELLKIHEQPINDQVEVVRQRIYQQHFADSLFAETGSLKTGSAALSAERPDAADFYFSRYVNFFPGNALTGLKVLVYQHSAVGRDLLVDIVKALGAEVVVTGRSETFVPIDTENMDAAQLALIQSLYDAAAAEHGQFIAVISTDGDSDRPLILGVSAGKVQFFGGDLVGMLTAELLNADAVVVPISSNDGIDRSVLKTITAAKTKIGSPFVIAGMLKALAAGKHAVCGWEANGGFLTGSNLHWQGRSLSALPTRDALLPILAMLYLSKREQTGLKDIFARLPKRFSRAALIKQLCRSLGLALVQRYSPTSKSICTVDFTGDHITVLDENEQALAANNSDLNALTTIRNELHGYFSPALGFTDIERINYVDGVRLYFSNGDVAHMRPSGNADELRIYAVADNQERADAIASMAVAEPNGLLRQMVKAVS